MSTPTTEAHPSSECRVVKDILVPNGWADAGIVTQQSLLPSLKVAAPATVKAREENKLATPQMVSLQLQVS